MKAWALGACLVTLLSFCRAETTFFTSSVSYCSPSRAVVVNKFGLEYNPTLNTLSFDINAASVSPDLNPIFSLSLDAYGIVPINFSVNLCDFLYGLLCPLPQFEFEGAATLPLTPVIGSGVSDKIPRIAYILPNLQAVATVKLIRVEDGLEAACLQVHLSNGKTVQLASVAWGFGAIALTALLVGIFGALVGFWKGYDVERGRMKERLLVVVSFFQFAATTGLLHLAYPTVYLAFTANLGWALGLIYENPIQSSIESLRARTGGNLTVPDGNVVYGSGVDLLKVPDTPLAPATTRAVSMMSQLAKELYDSPHRLLKRQSLQDEPLYANVTATDPFNQVNSGIPQFLARLQISPFNGFMTVFYNFLFLICLFIVVAAILALPTLLAARRGVRKEAERHVGGHRSAGTIAFNLLRSNALRLLIISWYPILIFAFYQWTIGSQDAYAPIVLSVFTWLATTIAIVVMAGLAMMTIFKTRETPEEANEALTGPSGSRAYSPFWNSLRPKRYWFFVPLLVGTFIRALFIALSQDRGWVQTVGLLVIETLVFLAMCIFTPYQDRSLNCSTITIQIVRVIISAALITFNTSIDLNDIARTVVGFILIVLISVTSLGLFLLLIIDLVAHIIRIFRRSKVQVPTQDMEELDTRNERSAEPTTDSTTLRDPSPDSQANESNAPKAGENV